jgi:hypothetical protein
MTADTLLVRRYEVHSNKPLNEWQFGILKDSTHQAREISSTTLATKSTISSYYTMMLSTIWAYNITINPTTFNDGLLTHFFRVEVCCKRYETIELSEIYHNATYFLIYTTKILYKIDNF